MHRVALLGVSENPVASSRCVQEGKAQASGALLSGGQEQRQAFHCEAPFAEAQVVEPDQAEGEAPGRVRRIRVRPDRGPARLPLSQERARVGGRQAVFQIGLGAEFGDAPPGELSRQKLPEPLAKHHPRPAPLPTAGSGTRQVNQHQCALFMGKALYRKLEFARPLLPNRGDPAHQVTFVIPGLDRQARTALFQSVIVRLKSQQVLTGFEKGGFAARLKKTLDRRPEFGHQQYCTARPLQARMRYSCAPYFSMAFRLMPGIASSSRAV